MSRRDVLIVTGNAGVGKTTTSREWALRRRGAAVRGDEIRLWFRIREMRQAEGYQEAFIARVALAAAKEFIARKLDVALDFVWKPSGLSILRDGLGDAARVRVVRLWCEPSENHRRDELRTGNDVMGPRVDELGRELAALDWPADVTVVDSTGLTLDETLAAIERTFGDGRA